MKFSLKIPGMRVTSKGRVSIGPRAARIHTGKGRTGFSTGAGPLGVYTTSQGRHRRGQSSEGGSPMTLDRFAGWLILGGLLCLIGQLWNGLWLVGIGFAILIYKDRKRRKQ